jgi:hypothetical protein
MKHRPFIFALLIVIFFESCKKNKISIAPLASLNVVATVVGGDNVKLNNNSVDSAKAYNSNIFGIVAGSSNVLIYPTSSLGKPYYNGVIESENGDNYSLFLSGYPNNVDAILVKENIPEYYSDSMIGIRVVNLSPTSSSLNISLASATNTNVFSNVVYKQVTDFIKFSLPTVIPSGSVSFQIRDAANTLLSTYTLPTAVTSNYPGISVQLSRFRNITLVIRGLQGVSTGSDAFGVFPVANY